MHAPAQLQMLIPGPLLGRFNSFLNYKDLKKKGFRDIEGTRVSARVSLGICGGREGERSWE